MKGSTKFWVAVAATVLINIPYHTWNMSLCETLGKCDEHFIDLTLGHVLAFIELMVYVTLSAFLLPTGDNDIDDFHGNFKHPNLIYYIQIALKKINQILDKHLTD